MGIQKHMTLKRTNLLTFHKYINLGIRVCVTMQISFELKCFEVYLQVVNVNGEFHKF